MVSGWILITLLSNCKKKNWNINSQIINTYDFCKPRGQYRYVMYICRYNLCLSHLKNWFSLSFFLYIVKHWREHQSVRDKKQTTPSVCVYPGTSNTYHHLNAFFIVAIPIWPRSFTYFILHVKLGFITILTLVWRNVCELFSL